MRMVQGLARLRDLLDGEERTRMNERLFDYLLDELAPDERAAFEADPARVAEAERLRPIVTRLESLERERVGSPGGACACAAARARAASGAAAGPRGGAACCP